MYAIRSYYGQWHERRRDPDELAYWNEQLVGYGVIVMLRRRDAVIELDQRAAEALQRLLGSADVAEACRAAKA